MRFFFLSITLMTPLGSISPMSPEDYRGYKIFQQSKNHKPITGSYWQCWMKIKIIYLYGTSHLVWHLLLNQDFYSSRRKQSSLSHISHHKEDSPVDCSPFQEPLRGVSHCIQIQYQQHQPCTFRQESLE